jgi:diaminohydroxyphosphoribosylaminopyrimidine deaminase/5-amino-6-(5-phosphoribosylamino)uracil reductase
VILKWAQSLDGRIATRTGDSQWISDEQCRRHAHRVRARVDAILVGRNTVLRDDPQLTARTAPVRRVATRVVLDARLDTPLAARLVRSARTTPTWVISGPRAPRSRGRSLEAAGCRVRRVPSEGDRVSLPAVLDLLGSEGMTNVLVEGGGELLGGFVDQRLADELHVYIAPLLIGGAAAVPALGATGPELVRDALRLPADTHVRRLGDGWFVRARLQ